MEQCCGGGSTAGRARRSWGRRTAVWNAGIEVRLGLYIARGNGISKRRNPGNEFDRGEAKSAAAQAFPWEADEVA